MANMENDMISRAILRAEIENDQRDGEEKTDCAFKEGFACGLELALERIENAPTIDAEPVVHARWVDVPPECSACGIYQPTDDWDQYIDYPHCPYCGARMDVLERSEGRK